LIQIGLEDEKNCFADIYKIIIKPSSLLSRLSLFLPSRSLILLVDLEIKVCVGETLQMLLALFCMLSFWRIHIEIPAVPFFKTSAIEIKLVFLRIFPLLKINRRLYLTIL